MNARDWAGLVLEAAVYTMAGFALVGFILAIYGLLGWI